MKVTMLRRNHYIVTSPDGGLYIIDSGFDATARNITVPFLRRYYPGVPIRGIFITHAHSNHTGGVPHILRTYGEAVGGVYTSGITGTGTGNSYWNDPIIWNEIISLCHDFGIPYTTCGAGEVVADPTMTIRILSPLPAYQGETETDDPDGPTTMAFQFVCEDGSALFCGDLGDSGRYQLMEVLTSTDVTSDVWAIPHHGDVRCINDEILAEIQPRYVLAELIASSRDAIAYASARGIPGHSLFDGPIEVRLSSGQITTNKQIVDRFPIARLPL